MTGLRRPGRGRGFSLVEALVALALLAVVTVLAAELWVEAARRLAAASQEARAPHPSLATALLTTDVRQARDVGLAPGPTWSGVLPLTTPRGAVAWGTRGRRLVRVVRDLRGRLHERPLVDGVTLFRSRAVTPDLVEVELWVTASGGTVSALGGWRPHPLRARRERIHLLLGVRQRRGTRGW